MKAVLICIGVALRLATLVTARDLEVVYVNSREFCPKPDGSVSCPYPNIDDALTSSLSITRAIELRIAPNGTHAHTFDGRRTNGYSCVRITRIPSRGYHFVQLSGVTVVNHDLLLEISVDRVDNARIEVREIALDVVNTVSCEIDSLGAADIKGDITTSKIRANQLIATRGVILFSDVNVGWNRGMVGSPTSRLDVEMSHCHLNVTYGNLHLGGGIDNSHILMKKPNDQSLGDLIFTDTLTRAKVQLESLKGQFNSLSIYRTSFHVYVFDVKAKSIQIGGQLMSDFSATSMKIGIIPHPYWDLECFLELQAGNIVVSELILDTVTAKIGGSYGKVEQASFRKGDVEIKVDFMTVSSLQAEGAVVELSGKKFKGGGSVWPECHIQSPHSSVSMQYDSIVVHNMTAKYGSDMTVQANLVDGSIWNLEASNIVLKKAAVNEMKMFVHASSVVLDKVAVKKSVLEVDSPAVIVELAEVICPPRSDVAIHFLSVETVTQVGGVPYPSNHDCHSECGDGYMSLYGATSCVPIPDYRECSYFEEHYHNSPECYLVAGKVIWVTLVGILGLGISVSAILYWMKQRKTGLGYEAINP